MLALDIRRLTARSDLFGEVIHLVLAMLADLDPSLEEQACFGMLKP